MGNVVLQEFLGAHSNELNTLADCATACALVIAVISYRLSVKQLRNERYIKASEWSISFADTFRAEVLPRMKLFSFVSSEVPIYAQSVMSLSVHSLSSFSEKELISIANTSSSAIKQGLLSYLADKDNLEKAVNEYLKLAELHPGIFTPIDRSCIDGEAFATLFNKTLTELSNYLEQLSLMVNSGLANEEVLYPSFHRPFFRAVNYVFPFLCSVNNGREVGNYSYTHIVKLMELWGKRERAIDRGVQGYQLKIDRGYEINKEIGLKVQEPSAVSKLGSTIFGIFRNDN